MIRIINEIQKMDTQYKCKVVAKFHSKLVHFLMITVLGYFGFGVLSAQSSELAQSPLFLSTSVEPNIMFTLDDSGSMQWEYMPDSTNFRYTIFMFPRPAGLYGGTNYTSQVPSFRDDSLHNYFGRSAANNGVFYNPDITYQPWTNADGTLMPNANPRNALYNPALPQLGGLNLVTQQTQSATWFRGTAFDSAFCDPCGGNHTFWPITYYNYTGGNRTNRNSYQRVQITTATPAGATFTSPNGTTRTRDEEIQNFANWFQYSRSRVLAARSGIGRAFAELSEDVRVGFGAINQGNHTVDNVTTRTVIDGVRQFSGSNRQGFYDRLYNRVINNFGTPLRSSASAVGTYFERTDSRGPWSTTPGLAGGDDLSCRQSFHILMTDGFYNGANPNVGNADNTAGPIYTDSAGNTLQYSPVDPFRDDLSNTLGDVAMEYWKRDLRPDIDNNVPTSPSNPAFWQHVTTFGIGLGVQGNLNPDDVFQAVENNTAIDWGNPFSGDAAIANPAKIDDLLHFGINGRGGFFSASDPDEFAESLGQILIDITSRTESSATAAAVSSAVIEDDTRTFFAGFRSTDWSGSLTSRPIDRDGNIAAPGCSECWNAETRLAARATAGNRNIFTRSVTSSDLSSDGNGVIFNWSNLNNVQQAALNHSPENINDGRGADRLAWLTGTEVSGFRNRRESGSLRVLGDIVNSDPVYFNNVLYVAANDGMLHAFDGDTGDELFAYVPSSLLLPEDGENFAPLSQLMSTEYIDNHRYFVDGPITVRSVIHNNELRTILVGSLGAGGKQIYALDVTEPDNFTPSKVLWEFAHPEMGASVGAAQIARAQPNGDWRVFLGNGYGGDSDEAGLFVIDLFTGDLVEYISTETGDATSANGLATPFVTDWPNGGFRADRVYAGDLLGNLWAFDVSNSQSNRWSARILAKATDPSDNPQPITTKPIGQVINTNQVMISFGTGSFQFNADAYNPQIQSLYGVIDQINPESEPATRSDLISQNIIYETSVSTSDGERDIRVISNNPINLNDDRGWVLDLDLSVGERIISNPTTLGRLEKRVRFSSLIPDEDPCGTGRSGFFYDLDLISGGRVEVPVFDLDDDGNFGDGDLVDVPGIGLVPPSGIGFGQGESATSTVTTDEEGKRSQLICDGQGNCERVRDGDQTLGRMSWQQLK